MLNLPPLLYFNFTLNFAGLVVSEPLIRPPGSKVQISIPTLTRGVIHRQITGNLNLAELHITPLGGLRLAPPRLPRSDTPDVQTVQARGLHPAKLGAVAPPL